MSTADSIIANSNVTEVTRAGKELYDYAKRLEAEHAALMAVAEAATKVSDAVAEGCSSEAAYLLGLNQNLIEAIANLAAVREGRAVQS